MSEMNWDDNDMDYIPQQVKSKLNWSWMFMPSMDEILNQLKLKLDMNRIKKWK